jgi:hypothetical protein
LDVQLNIHEVDLFRWIHLSDVPPPVGMVEFGENIAVGRAYFGVRVPIVKLAAPVVEESVGLVTVCYGRL